MLPFHLGLAHVRGESREPGFSGRYRRRALLSGSGRHRSAERAAVAIRLQVRRLLRRPAGGPRAGQAQPRRRHGELPDQRRRRPDRPPASEWNGGERYGPGNGTYYHVVQWRGDRDKPGRQRENLVHRRWRSRATRSPTRSSPTPASRVLILSAEDYTGASPAMPGVTAPSVPLLTTRTRSRRTARVRRLRRRRQRPHRARQPRSAQPLRRRRSGTPVTTSSRASRAGLRATPRASRCRSCSRCATSSTRAVACSTRPGRRAAVHAGPRCPALRPLREQGSAVRTLRSRHAAWRCSAQATRRAIRSSTCSAQRSPLVNGGLDPETADPFLDRRDRRPAQRPQLDPERRRQRSEPDDRLVVHRDRDFLKVTDPDRQLPAV